MASRILIINGHPDSSPERLCTALCTAYSAGALSSGHGIRRLDVGALDFPLIWSSAAFEDPALVPDIAAAQASVAWAKHIVIVFPLWLGGPPALLKAFFEQTFRYGFAIPGPGGDPLKGLLGGRSARVVVTMGMPAAVYRLMFGAFGVRSVETSILRLSGIRPVDRTLLGGVGGARARYQTWLDSMRRLGARAG